MSAIKERPILFSAPMVRAILEGRKTVTRRAVKPQFQTAPVDVVDGVPSWDSPSNYAGEVQMNTQRGKPCPYGQPGERLWVREGFGEIYDYCEHPEMPGCPDEHWHIAWKYRADGEFDMKEWDGVFTGWKPSIHMPRVACRILLEITDVRVERLQAITWEQALDEGIGDHRFECDRPVEPDGYPACSCGSVGYVDTFAVLWNSTGGDWDANPWVWVVEFRRVQP
ncbi:hypothetical protein ACIOWK_27360 [Pseudomonas protegens]|uniref:hypothetical protein n=1 Tax=Pseudomonas protegens TaxID=380021 RepID=UPI00381E7C18